MVFVICEECDHEIPRDSAIYSEAGDAYCEECYRELFAICEECQRETASSEIYVVEVDGREMELCERCADRLAPVAE